MSASTAVFFACCRECLKMKKLVNSGVMNIIYRSYSSNRKKKMSKFFTKDPRQNAQYPFTPGDPYHELILESKSGHADHDVRKGNKMDRVQTAAFVSGNKHVTQYGHTYEKLKDGDLRLGRTILKAKSSNDPDTILLEGQRLIKDSIHLGADIKNLYFCEEEILKDFSPSILMGVHIFKIPYRDMKTWSGTTTPSGILGVFKKPQQGETYSCEESRLPLTVILDEIKDPGNVGTLIRSAAAVGCERILALKGCADVWEGKVLRSAMGGHFAVPIYNKLTWSQVYSYVKEHTQVFLADARAENDVKMEFDERISVEQLEEVPTTDSDSDSSSSDSDDEGSSQGHSSPPRAKTSPQNDLYSRVPFPVIPYSNLVLRPPDSGEKFSVALVIGNETEGLSLSAKKFAYNCYGTYVTIPMNPSVDSLNTAVAGSIMLYEIQRKLLDLVG